MYIGIDVGGTKTLVASLDAHGVITQKIRFETPQDYDEFLVQAEQTVRQLKTQEFAAGGIGLPGTLDRKHGRVIWFGNLPWKNVPVQTDIEKITHCPMVMENDAKMATLSEAMLLKHKYDKVMYITVSTGIGIGLVVDRQIVTEFGDAGGRTMLVERHGTLMPWEEFASGRAIVKRFGKMAKDIDDAKTWGIIARDLSRGMLELIALFQPEVIVIGGSVGTHFPKYGKLLTAELKKHETPLMPIPPIQGAGRPEEAVLFGCYDLARQTYGESHAHAR